MAQVVGEILMFVGLVLVALGIGLLISRRP